MAIKRKNFSYNAEDDVTHFCPAASAAGGIVCYTNTAAFTDNPDDPDNKVGYIATIDEDSKPAGLLMMDVIDYDPTRVPRNEQNPYEVVVGSKVWVRTGGYVDTNMVVPADLASIVAGETAYLADGGLVTNVTTDGIKVGVFGSYADADGYVKLYLNINQ